MHRHKIKTWFEDRVQYVDQRETKGVRDRWFLNFLFYEVDARGHKEMSSFLADQ